MEGNDKTRMTVVLFETLVRRLLDTSFRFPGGESGRRAVAGCLEILRANGSGALSDERIADFCICQVHVISRFGADYLAHRWMPAHSFGAKARERFAAATPVRRHYEDRWLGEAGVSRTALPFLLKDRQEHPLWQFLDPAYEEVTKQRVVNTSVGYYICGISTLLWNPFSATCGKCCRMEACRKRTAARYPELYRLRVEETGRRTHP